MFRKRIINKLNNNYLTIRVIANNYGITERQAEKLKKDGKEKHEISARLQYLKKQIIAECISYEEIAEIQSLAPHIAKGDTLLQKWFIVPEFETDTMLTRQDFKELTKTINTDYGIKYKTVTPSCTYSQSVDNCNKYNSSYSIDHYVDYYYNLYLQDVEVI